MLLVLPDDEMRQVVALLDAVAAAPLDRTVAVFYDAEGRPGYACGAVQFRVYFYIAKNERVTFSDPQHAPESWPLR
jgi:hypothetical protein